MKRPASAAVFTALLIALSLPALAQESPTPLLPPQPVPPLSDKQRDAVRQLIQQEAEAAQQSQAMNQELNDRIRSEIKSTFGWTLTLVNLLLTVLIAVFVAAAIGAWLMRRHLLAAFVTGRALQAESHAGAEQLPPQGVMELQDQVAALKQELETQRSTLLAQMQSVFVAAQQEKEQIFRDLSKLSAAHADDEAIAPEVQQRLQALTQQLEQLQTTYPQLYLTADDYVRQGDALCLERRVEEALMTYETAIDRQPEHTAAWLGKAKALRILQRYEEALAADARAIDISPDQAPTWYSKAVDLIELQRYSEALKALNKSITIDPVQGDAWRERGYVLTKLDRYAEAWTSLEKSTKLQPELGKTYYRIAYYHAARGQVDQCLTALQQALQLQPQLRSRLQADSDFATLQEDDRLTALINAKV
jgi:tetratricopeptide (TPR) repeat protein